MQDTPLCVTLTLLSGAHAWSDTPLPFRSPTQSLALAHCEVNDAGTVIFSPWTETDFRTGLEPWWA